jgi:hypothetical protein
LFLGPAIFSGLGKSRPENFVRTDDSSFILKTFIAQRGELSKK